MSGEKILQAGPMLELRKQTEPAPELGGSVICRGLLASEAFAVTALRQQAFRRARVARAEWLERVKASSAEAVGEFEAPAMDFDELRAYGRYVSHLLACGVTVANGMGLYTAEQWEVVGQHHPGLAERLQRIVERLSGLDAEDVEKNLPPTPS